MGGFLRGSATWTFTVSGDRILQDTEHSLYLKPSNMQEYYPCSKQNFISGLCDIHIGEWNKTYDNPSVFDGTQWELEIQYEDGRKPVVIYGSNAYPYNFKDMTDLLDVEWEEEESDENEQITE